MEQEIAPHERAFPPPAGSDEENAEVVAEFRGLIYRHYREYARSLPWRETKNPYHILVSEIMLQQTQTERVGEKYAHFIETFPTYRALAEASLRDVLRAWKGLGYNRRAMALRHCARRIVEEHGGVLPADPAVLVAFPGIGKATAASICAFAFDKPIVFIETNIRRVFIHFFFRDATDVHDRAIFPLIEQTLDATDPRTWYYALMDYGAMLKRRYPNPNRKSAHYARQSRFEGSDRQIRGRIIRALTDAPCLTSGQIVALVGRDADRVAESLHRLKAEGFLVESGDGFAIA